MRELEEGLLALCCNLRVVAAAGHAESQIMALESGAADWYIAARTALRGREPSAALRGREPSAALRGREPSAALRQQLARARTLDWRRAPTAAHVLALVGRLA
jgi:hypothetical protein